MRPLGVEFLDEGIEAGLLLQAVHAGWAGCLALQRQMHPFMTTVLLRIAGLDALDGNTEPQPPDRQPGEVEEGIGAGERDAVVGADGVRQSALGEQALERRDRALLADGVEGLAEQQEARRVIGDGERVAIVAVAEAELTFEIGAPEVIVIGAGGKRRALGAVAAPPRRATRPWRSSTA